MARFNHNYVGFLIACLSLAFALTCKSAPIQEAVAKQIVALEAVKEDIEESDWSPEQKKAGVAVIDNAQKLIREQGQTITEQQTEIENLADYRRWFFIENSILVLLAAGFIWKRFL